MGTIPAFAYGWTISHFQFLCPRDMVVYYYSCDPCEHYPHYTELLPYIIDANTNYDSRWTQRYRCLCAELNNPGHASITADAEAIAGRIWSDEELGL